jgi:hypothetical protein
LIENCEVAALLVQLYIWYLLLPVLFARRTSLLVLVGTASALESTQHWQMRFV